MPQAQPRAKVGRRELTSMLTLFVAAHAFLIFPIHASSAAMEAAWMEPIIAAILALVVFLILDFMFRRFFPGDGLLKVMKQAFGKYISGVFAIGLAAYFVYVTASIMRQFTESVIITVLPSTPILVISALFIITVGYVATCGLEAIVRVAQLAFPFVVLAMIALCLMTLNWWHPALLLPVLGSGIPSIAIGGLQSSPIYLSILLLCIIYPHAKDYRDLRKVGVRSTIYSMLLLVAFLLVYHMVFAPAETSKLASPIYSVARLVHIGRFVQRIESVYIFIWVSAAVLKMSITVWAAAYILTDTFDWPSYRPIIPALGLFCAAISMFPSDVQTVAVNQEFILMRYGWMVVFVWPMLVLVIGALRKGMKRGVSGA